MKKRLGESDNEIAAGRQYYEYMVTNDDLNQAVDEVIRIIKKGSLLKKAVGDKQ